jgi:Fe-S-cluster-containing hydrogenase component 2
MKRQIVKINEDLCNGCGVCVTPCVEGAVELVNGKARVVSDELCDGAGFCLAVCPTGALTVEERDAVPFSEQAAEEHQHARGKRFIAQKCFRCGASEESAVLMPARWQGASLWVCTHCLPSLIHG